MTYTRLVANGCSYMEVYTLGKGHTDLAQRLGIDKAESLALGGSANSRIIRTTLKDSYTATEPTLYVLGMTFVARNEIPILKVDLTKPGASDDYLRDLSLEGRWTNPQSQMFKKYWEHHWTQQDTDRYVELMRKAEAYSSLDRTEDLMYRFLSMISDLQSRGHDAVIYNQADITFTDPLQKGQILSDAPKLKLFKSSKNFVHGLVWTAIQWQHSQGVASTTPNNLINRNNETPEEMKHRKPGEHQKLNEYLTAYIKDNKII